MTTANSFVISGFTFLLYTYTFDSDTYCIVYRIGILHDSMDNYNPLSLQGGSAEAEQNAEEEGVEITKEGHNSYIRWSDRASQASRYVSRKIFRGFWQADASVESVYEIIQGYTALMQKPIVIRRVCFWQVKSNFRFDVRISLPKAPSNSIISC